ncbi:MAG: AAA family ATPase [Nannocystaceae bacterium]|nr:AAA family ATPase [Nannocystaceae bacterium]
MSKPLFLTGMMGSGKSTVGRLLAASSGATFVDLDERIERLFGRSIAALFEDGEESFRDMEGRALQTLIDEPGFCGRAVVVATGGGVVIQAGNRQAMHQAGSVVFLDADPETLLGRLLADELERPGCRPLLNAAADSARAQLDALLSRRRAAYEACDVSVDATAAPHLVAAQVQAALQPTQPGARPSESETTDSEAV